MIGTHRLLAATCASRTSGLVIIDEEQRFGVEVKERLKALPRTVDVLTHDRHADPAHAAHGLSGLRDISIWKRRPRTGWPSRRVSRRSAAS